MRTTMGAAMFRSRAAATTPVASVSQRKMPPKMLISTAFTCGSESRMRNAFFTCSALAPPPTSRKFAGLPPAYTRGDDCDGVEQLMDVLVGGVDATTGTHRT